MGGRTVFLILGVWALLSFTDAEQVKGRHLHFETKRKIAIKALSACPDGHDLAVVGYAEGKTEDKSDFFVAKIDGKDLSVKWHKIHGTEEEDGFNAVVCSESNVISAVGYTRGTLMDNKHGLGDLDMAFIQYDEDGKILYFESSGASGKDDYATAIKQRSNGRLVIGGSSHGLYWVGLPGFVMLEYSARPVQGEHVPEVWGRNLGGSQTYSKVFLDVDSAEGISYLLGKGIEESEDGISLIKMVGSNLDWTLPIAVSGADVQGMGVGSDKNGLPLVLSTRTTSNQTTSWISKYTTTGVLIWEKNIGAVQAFSDGLFVAPSDHLYIHVADGSGSETILRLTAHAETDSPIVHTAAQRAIPKEESPTVREFAIDSSNSKLMMYSASDNFVSVFKQNLDEPLVGVDSERQRDAVISFEIHAKSDGNLRDGDLAVSVHDVLLDMLDVKRSEEFKSQWYKKWRGVRLDCRVLVFSEQVRAMEKQIHDFVSDESYASALSSKLSVSSLVSTYEFNPDTATYEFQNGDTSSGLPWHFYLLAICGAVLLFLSVFVAIHVYRSRSHSKAKSEKASRSKHEILNSICQEADEV